MQCGNQSRELVFLDILQLVHHENDAGLGGFGGFSDSFHELCKVVLKIAAIRQAGFGVGGETDSDVSIRHFESAYESRERPHCARCQVRRRLSPREFAERRAEMWRQHGGKGAVFGRFYWEREDAVRLGVLAHPVKQNRLADAAQADHDEAAAGASGSDAL